MYSKVQIFNTDSFSLFPEPMLPVEVICSLLCHSISIRQCPFSAGVKELWRGGNSPNLVDPVMVWESRSRNALGYVLFLFPALLRVLEY